MARKKSSAVKTPARRSRAKSTASASGSTSPRSRRKKATPADGSKPKNAATLAKAVLNNPSDATKKEVKPVTHVQILLDKSISMDTHREGAIKAFNNLLGPIQEQAKDQDIRVSLYQFGTQAYDPIVQDLPADKVRPITTRDYDPNDGATALYSAMIRGMEDATKLPDYNEQNVSFLQLVITDGEENSSFKDPTATHGPKWTPAEVRDKIATCQATDRWTFVVSTPDRYVNSIRSALGIPKGNVQGWNERDQQGMDTVSTAQTQGLRSYLGGRSRGVTRSDDFFAQVNIGKMGIRAITKELDPEPVDRFRKLKVKKQCQVREIPPSYGLEFKEGLVFYNLIKKETVQDYKEILLERKTGANAGKIYGGEQVRDLLGIPHGQEGTVEPGNLGDWNVWIQSTSPNRKFVAGMEVLYDTTGNPSSRGRTTW
jgi:hypothetical protein